MPQTTAERIAVLENTQSRLEKDLTLLNKAHADFVSQSYKHRKEVTATLDKISCEIRALNDVQAHLAAFGFNDRTRAVCAILVRIFCDPRVGWSLFAILAVLAGWGSEILALFKEL